MTFLVRPRPWEIKNVKIYTDTQINVALEAWDTLFVPRPVWKKGCFVTGQEANFLTSSKVHAF